MSRTPTEPSHDPIFREINLSAEVKRMWGQAWNSPELAYEFGDRKFYLKTEDAGIYTGKVAGVGSFILLEDGSFLLAEDGFKLYRELLP